GQPAVDETTGAFDRGGQFAANGDVARSLQRKDEPGWRFGGPFRIGGRLLRTVIGAVDLDRAQMPAGIFQLASLYQLGRVEIVAPRRISPAADTRTNVRAAVAGGGKQVGHGAGSVVVSRASVPRRYSAAPMHSTSHAAPAA